MKQTKNGVPGLVNRTAKNISNFEKNDFLDFVTQGYRWVS